jgi:hypothetical protein
MSTSQANQLRRLNDAKLAPPPHGVELVDEALALANQSEYQIAAYMGAPRHAHPPHEVCKYIASTRIWLR